MGKRRRKGALLTCEMIVILPLAVAVGLTIVQFILIATAKFRVEVAATKAADLAASGSDVNALHEAAGLILAPHLDSAYETEVEYYNKFTDGNATGDKGQLITADPGIDHVVVSVRIPMDHAAPNWLGFMGGSVANLHIRSIVKMPISQEFAFQDIGNLTSGGGDDDDDDDD